MSRCFPFPPPGYERKTRTDEVDLLKKEKQREKKHKKDKKDKEKRESKEKREKEGRDGKHKEKDKKEKHREKKKDKDKSRNRDKSKISTADDKGFPGQSEGPNASSKLQKEIKQSDKKGILFENKLTKQYTGNHGEKARENNHVAEENKDSKFLQELDRRIKADDGGAGNQLVQKFTNMDHRKDEGTVRLVAKGSGTWPDGKEKLKDKGLDAKKIDGKGVPAEIRPIGNATVQNHAGNFHPRVDGMPKLLGKYFDRSSEATVEGKEKVKEKKDEGKEKVKEKKDEGEEKVKRKKDEGKEKVKEKKDDKRGDKRKNKEKEKKGHGKDKDRDKEKKKEEKAKEHSELKTTEQNKLKENNNVGPIGSNSFTQVSRNSHDIAVSGESLKKRKDMESNGVPRANDNRPSKLPKLSPSHPFTENGRILEPCQISIPNASDRPGVATSVVVENKECKINGIIESRPLAVSSNKTHTATVPADLVNEASAKPPHPDIKYLREVYLVPKVKEWSDFDDQEWLFSSSILQERKPVAESSAAGETPQVWAEALHIEPADITALPYVLPY